MVECPICDKQVKESNINPHIDSGCEEHIEDSTEASSRDDAKPPSPPSAPPKENVASFFQPTAAKHTTELASKANGKPSNASSKPTSSIGGGLGGSKYAAQAPSAPTGPKRAFGSQGGQWGFAKGNKGAFGSPGVKSSTQPQTNSTNLPTPSPTPTAAENAEAIVGAKRPAPDQPSPVSEPKRRYIEDKTIKEEKVPAPSLSGTKRPRDDDGEVAVKTEDTPAVPKRAKTSTSTNLQKAAPLAERMRPITMDDVLGQSLVGKNGALRALVEQDRVPSIILWGGPGTGKTTIARIIAHQSGSRFVEINSTSTGVAECKKLFAEARNELGLTGRKTIIFCDEIHRFTKTQQDVFLGPVEAGQITLIGATTENPSFKVINALLSRCRTFTLSALTEDDILAILNRALTTFDTPTPALISSPSFLKYISAFSSGDARTALNLLEISLSIATSNPALTAAQLKQSLTQTLVYDRAGDSHYDTISALHKSIRGSDPDASLYYLARMLHAGEDALFIARRLVVVASEDVGLADNSMLSLAAAAYTAVEKVGMPEARIALAHAVVALALARKSTRAYRGLAKAMRAIESEPEVAGLRVPMHLRNAPTRLLKEMGAGREYKYNPAYRDGRVKQEYLPEKLKGRVFLEDLDLGTEVDPDLEEGEEEVKEDGGE